MASIVSSEDMEESNRIAIMVQFPLVNLPCTFSGRISIGTDKSATESYQMTDFTWLTPSICSRNEATSRFSIPSTTQMENAPVWNSSIRISCPCMVSISLGR